MRPTYRCQALKRTGLNIFLGKKSAASGRGDISLTRYPLDQSGLRFVQFLDAMIVPDNLRGYRQFAQKFAGGLADFGHFFHHFGRSMMAQPMRLIYASYISL